MVGLQPGGGVFKRAPAALFVEGSKLCPKLARVSILVSQVLGRAIKLLRVSVCCGWLRVWEEKYHQVGAVLGRSGAELAGWEMGIWFSDQ